MSDTPQFASRSNADSAREEIDHSFFELYAETSALSKPSRRTGQAIYYFHESRARLDQELRKTCKSKALDSNTLDSIAIRHSLLALIHWLYPNFIGYNRLANAKLMYQHAVAATSTSRSRTSVPYVVGLMVQLRITPFLIKSRRSTQETLAKTREIATKIITKYEENSGLWGPIGIIQDGIGFSYFLLERDANTALLYLKKAIDCLALQEKTILNDLSDRSPSHLNSVRLSFFRAFLSAAFWDYGTCCESKLENTAGEQSTELSKETRLHYQRAYDYAKHTPWQIYKAMSAYNLAGTYWKEATALLQKDDAVAQLRKAVDLGEESLKWFNLWSTYEGDFLGGSWIATFYQQLAIYSNPSKRKKLMARSLNLAQKAEQVVNNRKVGLVRYKLVNIGDIFFHNSEYYRQLANQASSHPPQEEKDAIEILKKSLENCLRSRTYYKDEAYRNRMIDSTLLAGDICYDLMQATAEEGERIMYSKASKQYFNQAIRTSKQLGSNEKIAESHWRLARVFDNQGIFAKSASHYMRAHESYETARRSGELSVIYSAPSEYMLAWTKIERAKLAHRASKFQEASQLYSEAANLISNTRRWQSRSHLYVAQFLMEKAEKESLAENTQDAIHFFAEAVQAIAKLQSELESDESEDSKSFLLLATKIISFCNARIQLEKSKEAYRIGDTEQSVKGLSLAEEVFSELAKKSEASDSLGSNELNSLASLCNALVSFQTAQISGNSKLYLDAKEIFGKASEESKSRTLKSLLAGLESFATFLYYSKQIEESLDTVLDIEKILECNRELDAAKVVFTKLGNKSFLNMLKASKHILDATMKMNAAEREMGSATVKARLYGQAQRSLSRASKYYQLLGSSKRVKESLRMIGAVRNHQKLIPLAHDIIAEVASDQIIYTAISSATLFDRSPENSARDFDSAFVVLDISISQPFVTLGENISIELKLSNIGKQDAITVRIDEFIPEGFDIIENSNINCKDRSLLMTSRIGAGLSHKTVLTLKPQSAGEYIWHPSVVYLDAERNYRIARARTAKVVVDSAKFKDITSVLVEKEKLESELKQNEIESTVREDEASIERIYNIKERISKIEEDLFRLRNEYGKMNLQLDQTRTDLSILQSLEHVNVNSEERIRLENEVKLLAERIERRRKILEQAHLL